MNIFVSDTNPIQAAINLDDKRVKHMPREAYEMISMAYYINTGMAIAPFIIWNREHRYSPTKFHELFNHKCTKWVASKRENLVWLWNHAFAMMDECIYRFNKTHYLYDRFIEISHFIPNTTDVPKKFVNATPYDAGSVTLSYRQALNYKWFVTDEVQPVLWTNRDKPYWAIKPREILQGNLFYDYDETFDDLPF